MDDIWHWVFYNSDHEGSVTHLTDATGAVVEKYKYDAFGAPIIYNGAGAVISGSFYYNPFMFTGREYVPALGFYLYRARAYHPRLGRFMSEDPKLFDAGDYNLFRYCHNDPLDLTDPMGLRETQDEHQMVSPEHRSTVKETHEMFGYGAGTIASDNARAERTRNIFMRRADAIAKYEGNESGWIIDYQIPKNILSDPKYDWHWTKDSGGGALVRHFSLNRDIAPAVTDALNYLQRSGHLSDLHTFDGAFAVRNTRGSGQISAHAYGLALDINSDTMPRGSRALQPLALRTSFMRAGFVDGGTWVPPWAIRDPMHFTVGF